MTTTSRLGVAAAGLLVLALSACAPQTPPGGSSAPQPTPAETTEAPPQPEAIVVSTDGVSLVDDAGASVAEAGFDDAAGVLAFLGDWVGPVPAGTTTEFSTVYEWTGVTLLVNGDFATIDVTAAMAGDLDIRTADGIAVGSTRADVVALSPFDIGYDGDGDGQPDSYGLEPRPEPGTNSLTDPGAVGTTYIEAFTRDDAVWRLVSPAGDWRDV